VSYDKLIKLGTNTRISCNAWILFSLLPNGKDEVLQQNMMLFWQSKQMLLIPYKKSISYYLVSTMERQYKDFQDKNLKNVVIRIK